MTSRSEQIADAFKWSCLAELDAPKPGNVHIFAAGHRMTADAFAASADAAAPSISAEGARVGTRILGAVEATFTRVGANTNLGIILLCAPLAAAADADAAELGGSLGKVLQDFDSDDAALAFRAIVRAAPAGLGRSARHDVFEPAKVTLLQAMIEAADRDAIARQYATNFADIFVLGLPLFEAARQRHAGAKMGHAYDLSGLSVGVSRQPYLAEIRCADRRTGSPHCGNPSGVAAVDRRVRPNFFLSSWLGMPR